MAFGVEDTVSELAIHAFELEGLDVLVGCFLASRANNACNEKVTTTLVWNE